MKIHITIKNPDVIEILAQISPLHRGVFVEMALLHFIKTPESKTLLDTFMVHKKKKISSSFEDEFGDSQSEEKKEKIPLSKKLRGDL